MNDIADHFAREWDAAKTDEAKDQVSADFTYAYMTSMRSSISALASSAIRFHSQKYEAPTTFANVVMGALFTGADVAQKMFDDNFTTLEKTKIAETAARWIALLADYRPAGGGEGGGEAAQSTSADGFLTV